jgi:hypothetical protein
VAHLVTERDDVVLDAQVRHRLQLCSGEDLAWRGAGWGGVGCVREEGVGCGGVGEAV